MLEKEIEKKVVDYARARGVLVYKFASPAQRGVPDRMFLYMGKVMFIEFKAYGNKPTALQMIQISKLAEQGLPVYVVDEVWKGQEHVGQFIAHAEFASGKQYG